MLMPHNILQIKMTKLSEAIKILIDSTSVEQFYIIQNIFPKSSVPTALSHTEGFYLWAR